LSRTKLIFTGGGTRGMYQIGVYKALEECNLTQDVVSISGCSIGSLNACLFLQYSADESKEIWSEFSQKELFKNVNPYSKTYYLQLAKEFITGKVDLSPLRKVLETYIDEEVIRKAGKELVISAYNMTDLNLEYLSLDHIAVGKLIDVILASSRLPLFKDVYIRKNYPCD